MSKKLLFRKKKKSTPKIYLIAVRHSRMCHAGIMPLLEPLKALHEPQNSPNAWNHYQSMTHTCRVLLLNYNPPSMEMEHIYNASREKAMRRHLSSLLTYRGYSHRSSAQSRSACTYEAQRNPKPAILLHYFLLDVAM